MGPINLPRQLRIDNFGDYADDTLSIQRTVLYY
jgi:hypothetical protein